MKTLGVEFARRFPWRSVLHWSLSALLLAACAFLAPQIFENYETQRRLETQLIERRRAAALHDQQAAAASPSEPPAYLQDALKIARMAAYDVPKVLGMLEQTRVAGVRVAVINLSAEEELSQVELEILTMQALVDYLELINAGAPAGKGWRLERAQGPLSGAPGRATISLVRAALW